MLLKGVGGDSMRYIDEEIIENLNSYKKGVVGDIFENIYIKEKKCVFKEVSLFDNKMSIMLPEDFTDMPIQLAKVKYPSESRPNIIKTNLDTSINFTFNIFPVNASKNDIISIKDSFKTVIKKVYPANVFIEDVEFEWNNSIISLFDFKSFAVDEAIYNITFILPIGNNVVQGTFNSSYRDVEIWKCIAFEVIKSIKDLTI